jgi:hypothetical protein
MMWRAKSAKPCHPTIMDPRFLSQMAAYDMTSNISQALSSNQFKPSFLDLDGML